MTELAVQAAIFPDFPVMITGAPVCRGGATTTSGSVMLSYLRAVLIFLFFGSNSMYLNERRLLIWAGIGGLIAAWCVFTSDLAWSLVWEWPLSVAITIMMINTMLLLVDQEGDTPILDRLRIVGTDPLCAPFFGSISFACLWTIFAQGFAFWKIQTTVYPPLISQITSLDSKFLHEPIWGDLTWWASDAFLNYPSYVALGIFALHLGRLGYRLCGLQR